MRQRRLLAGCALSVLALTAGCGISGNLGKVQVQGSFGEKPELKDGFPVKIEKADARVLQEGSGPSADKGSIIRLAFANFDAKSGKLKNSNFGDKPQYLWLDETVAAPASLDSLIGRKEGSRLLLSLPPNNGAGEEKPSSKGKPGVLSVVDIQKVLPGKPKGAAVTPPAGLPQVQEGKKGEPIIVLPGASQFGQPATAPAPQQLLVQPLITGTGPKVQSGETISCLYTGVVWSTGQEFDTNFDKMEPADFGVGIGAVIKAWDVGLVGQTVGSRVMLVAPPGDAYGAQGSPPKIPANSTLVFVVDILDTYKETTPAPGAPTATP